MATALEKQTKIATLGDHFRELRNRSLVSISVLATSSIGVYFFYSQILKLLCAPLGKSLYYNNPAGSFSFILKICITGALFITVPVIVYNLIMFARPAFKDYLPKKRVYYTTFFSTICAIAGGIFAYAVILPGTLKFFAGFQVNGLKAMISADSYLEFVTNIIITFIVVFQLPLLILFIDNIKPLTPKKLLQNEKWVILGSLIVALIVPFTYDFLTSLFIALPIIALYNVAIVAILIKHYKLSQRYEVNLVQPIIRPEMMLNDEVIDNFTEELKSLDKNNASTIANNSAKAKAGSEIRPSTYKPGSIEPAEWVKERRLRKLAILNTQTHVFSDINRS